MKEGSSTIFEIYCSVVCLHRLCAYLFLNLFAFCFRCYVFVLSILSFWLAIQRSGPSITICSAQLYFRWPFLIYRQQINVKDTSGKIKIHRANGQKRNNNIAIALAKTTAENIQFVSNFLFFFFFSKYSSSIEFSFYHINRWNCFSSFFLCFMAVAALYAALKAFPMFLI